MLQYDRDYEEDPYWDSNNFWPRFLHNKSFDHVYLVDVFKTIIGDCDHRNWVLQQLIGDEEKFTSNYYAATMSPTDRLKEVKETWKKALRCKITAFITWDFPPVMDEDGNPESHFIMLIADPRNRSVRSIDSRGTEYINAFSPIWQESFRNLKNIFNTCDWIDVVRSDLQARNVNDHFCQTWSMILTVAVYKGKCSVGLNDEAGVIRIMDGFSAIIDFWRQLLQIHSCREAIYYEIYCKTHSSRGDRKYDRYFTTLECLIHRSNSVGYKKGLKYANSDYSFLEEFVDSLNDELLRQILA